MGDLNVILDDNKDLASYYNNVRFSGNTQEELMTMNKLIFNNNLTDTFRYLHKNAEEYTYFTYRVPQFRDHNIGMRLDYALASNSLIANKKIKASKILSDIGGSDHLPIYLSYKD